MKFDRGRTADLSRVRRWPRPGCGPGQDFLDHSADRARLGGSFHADGSERGCVQLISPYCVSARVARQVTS